MSNVVYIEKSNSVFIVLSTILKISITNISPDAESRKEQDGANHFSVGLRMTELWQNLCGDVDKKEEEGLLLFF